MPGIGGGPLFGSGSFLGSGSEYFPDPFLDIASTAMPVNPQDVLYWAEHICSKNGPFREALRRIVSYFLTDIEVVGEDVPLEEQDKFKAYLTDQLDYRSVLNVGLTNYAVYGNDFSFLHQPFRRYLRCPGCKGGEWPLSEVFTAQQFHFEWADYKFNATCPRCGYSGDWGQPIDRRGSEETDLKVCTRSPHEIDILYDLWTHDTSYIWRIPEDYRQDIRTGTLHHLERVPMEIVRAIKDAHYFKFAPQILYHMREPTFAGIRNRGWG